MALLEIRDLYKDFSGLKVLFGIDLAIEQGERHAIIGPNGAGKSTIFNLITGKYVPSRGKIFFQGPGYYQPLTPQNLTFRHSPLISDYEYFSEHDNI